MNFKQTLLNYCSEKGLGIPEYNTLIIEKVGESINWHSTVVVTKSKKKFCSDSGIGEQEFVENIVSLTMIGHLMREQNDLALNSSKNLNVPSPKNLLNIFCAKYIGTYPTYKTEQCNLKGPVQTWKTTIFIKMETHVNSCISGICYRKKDSDNQASQKLLDFLVLETERKEKEISGNFMNESFKKLNEFCKNNNVGSCQVVCEHVDDALSKYWVNIYSNGLIFSQSFPSSDMIHGINMAAQILCGRISTLNFL